MTILPGRLVDEVELPVERGKIREFARATFAADPVHTNESLALTAGFDGIPATATHSVAVGHYRDQAAFVASLGMSISRIVVGQVSWSYLRVLVEGDVLTASRVVESDERRTAKSGPMRIVTLSTRFVDQRGDLAQVLREVLIERGVE